MPRQEIETIKWRVSHLLGSLSIVEIMSNPPLIDQFKVISKLLAALAD